MATQVQSRRYSTGFSSILGLNEIASNDLLSLFHEDKAPKVSQYCDSLLPRHLTTSGSLQYDKEKVRQVILKHESTFRFQLQELHRLYGRQRELMSLLRRRDVKKGQIKAETSNLSPFSCNMFSEVVTPARHVSHTSPIHLVFGQSSISESSGKECLSCFSKGKSMLAFPSRDDRSSKICELPNSNGNLLQRRTINLQSPFNVYINNEEKHLEERYCGLSGIQSSSATNIHEILHNRDKKSFSFIALNNHKNGDALRSSLRLKGNNKLVDLSEPIQLEETSVSDTTCEPGNFTSNLDNKKKADLSTTSNSFFHPVWKDTSLGSIKDTNGGTCFNSLQSRNEGNKREQLTYDLKTKLMRPDAHSIMRDVCSKSLDVAFRSSQDDCRKINEFSASERGKTEGQIKRKLFGVDIFEVNDESLVTDTNMDNHANNIDEISSKSPFVQVKKSVVSNARSSFSSSIDGVSYQNGVSHCPQLNPKQSMGNSGVDSDFTKNTISSDLVQKEYAPIDLVKSVDGLECLDWRSSKVKKTVTITSTMFRDDIAPEHKSADCQSEPQILKGSTLCLMETGHCPEQNKKSHHLNLESLQNISQHFFRSTTKTTLLPSQTLTEKPEAMLPVLVHDSEETNTEVDDGIATEVKCSPLINNQLNISKDLTSASIFSKPTCLAADSNTDRDVEAEKVSSRDQPGGKDLNLEEPTNNSLSHLRGQFDLNLSVIEEEAPLAACLPTAIVKLATTEIDLEVPMVLECETDEGIEMLPDKHKEPCEGLVRVAAETIVAISASGGEDVVNDTTRDSLEATNNDCLKWFVEVVSSYEYHDESNAGVVNLSGDGALTEELLPDDMDYFEFMTLKLKDAKGENYFYNYKLPRLENQDEDEAKITTLSRPRRGHARRGRQCKDFQRDVLPSLISLSKLEVMEDIQTFEELLRATGCTWQSSFCRKSTAKNGRGRRRSGVMPSYPPLEQSPVSRELELGDKTLTGWGKRIRRLPRQRCVSTTTALPLNHD